MNQQISGQVQSLKKLAASLPEHEKTVVQSMILELDFIPTDKEKLEWLTLIDKDNLS